MVYCQHCSIKSLDKVRSVCVDFVSAVQQHAPEMLKKVKVHLILHLADNIRDFGPTSAFNTER